MLGHQLPHLPNVVEFWDELDTVFDWLAGRPVRVLDRTPAGIGIDLTWAPP